MENPYEALTLEQLKALQKHFEANSRLIMHMIYAADKRNKFAACHHEAVERILLKGHTFIKFQEAL